MYTEENLSTLSGPALVEAYNGLKPEKDVKRFSNRDTGIKRILQLQAERAEEVEDLGGEPLPPKVKPNRSKQAPVKPKRPAQASGGTRRKRFDEPYQGFTKPCREGTKRAKIVALLTKGATFHECMEATGWDQRTCYDGIKLVHKDLGYGLTEDEDGIIELLTK